MTKRLFIAIPLTADVRSAVSAYAQKLNLNIVWTKPNNLHITLVFLGDTDVEKIPAIRQAIDIISRNNRPFAISLSKAGYFRNSGALWVSIEKNRERLEQLANSIREELVKNRINFDGQHSFVAHLTIARNKKRIPIPRELPDFPSIDLPIKKIILFERQLTKPQVTYTQLHMGQL